jgi:Host cell surface-exposed lipoprotein/Protein of unknown function (DUF2510)
MTTPAGWHPDPEGSGQQRWWDGQQWTSALQGMPTAEYPAATFVGTPPAKAAGKKWPWIVGAVVVLFVVIGLVGSRDRPADVASATPVPTTQSVAATRSPVVASSAVVPSPAPAPITEPVVVAPVEAAPPVIVEPTTTIAPRPTPASNPESGMTGGQRNAVSSARSYLDFSSFSRQGLIEQLEYEDYSAADATFAVDYVSPDWNEQAAKSAESYLEFTSFSYQGLIDQLIYEGFTPAQAEYGVDQSGI